MTDNEVMKTQITEAIVDALKRVADDPEFSKRFWQRGFIELSGHASNTTSQWIGRKIAIWVATAMLGWLVVYLVKSGAIK